MALADLQELMHAWIAYAIVALVWGSTYVAIAEALELFTPLGLAPPRFLVAAALCWIIAVVRREPSLPRASYRHLAWSGLLMLSGANGLVCWGETRISSGMTAVLCATLPFFLVILERRPLNLLTMLGLGMGIGGVAVLTEPWSGTNDPWGVAAVLLANLFWALGTLHARKYVAAGSYSRQAAVQMAVAGIFGLIVAPLIGGYTQGPVTASALWAIVYLALFGSVLAFVAHAYLIRAWPPAKAGTYAFINPIVAVTLGAAIRHEVLSPQIGLGTAMCLMGVALVQFIGRSR